MMASEEQRRELYELLCTHLDQRTATLVLEVTVPANVELATRGDLQELRAELLLRFAQVEGRMVEMDARLSQRLAELDKKIDDVNTSLDKKIDDVHVSLDKKIDDVNVTLGKKIDDVNVSLGKKIDDVNVTLDKKIDDVNVLLGKKIDDVKNDVIRLDTRVAGLDTKLTGRIYKVVIPVLASWNLLVVAVAAWLVTLTG
jgi:tRNA uridine 5-carbamoylmethylation protein Kti12